MSLFYALSNVCADAKKKKKTPPCRLRPLWYARPHCLEHRPAKVSAAASLADRGQHGASVLAQRTGCPGRPTAWSVEFGDGRCFSFFSFFLFFLFSFLFFPSFLPPFFPSSLPPSLLSFLPSSLPPSFFFITFFLGSLLPNCGLFSNVLKQTKPRLHGVSAHST
uniref:cDNA FLJ27406 fis, clone WMC04317 n=1 Tax=Homo sapiens TaxID=9606 RepID=Q6ZNP3_HUMAN|nr:unnamed protein product [Homo sapiens]